MMSRHLSARLRAVLAAAALLPALPGAADSPRELIAATARRVVKIYGAGGVRGLEAYQSGVLVSPDGKIVTVLSTVLDSDAIDCVLDDGRRFPATLVGVDPRREIAVLSIEGEDLPAFVIEETPPRAPPGTRVVALSNLFGVAVGDERVSAQRGVVAAVVPLEARRGAAEAPYTGDVYVLDCTTNNPGSPGGALVDSRGRLVGLLGKELRATATGTWLNYALPIDEIARGIGEILSGTTAPLAAAGEAPRLNPRRLGLVLVPDLLDRTPPFVESVLPDSPAARAGLRPDDLVIAVGPRSIASRDALQLALGAIVTGDLVQLSIVRDGRIVDCDLGPLPGGEGP